MEISERVAIVHTRPGSDETRLAVLETKVDNMVENYNHELKRFTETQQSHHEKYNRISGDCNLLRIEVTNISERQLQQIEENKEIRKIIENNTEVIKSFETFLVRYTQEKETKKEIKQSTINTVANVAKSVTWTGGIIGMIYAVYRIIKGE